jgi:hypothetical protein
MPNQSKKTKRAKLPKACDCVEQVNKQLAKRNAALDTSLLMNFATMQASISPPRIQLRKVDSTRKRDRLPTLFAAYCPFCGKKVSE